MPPESADAADDPAEGRSAPVDDALEAQIQARVRASAEDARAQLGARLAAAARAAEGLRAEVDRAAPTPRSPLPPPPAPPAPVAATTPQQALRPPEPDAIEPSPEPEPQRAEPHWTEAGDDRRPSDPTAIADLRDGSSPRPRVPFGGPAAAVTGALGRAAPAPTHEPVASGTPMAELRISGLGADLDQRGDQLLVYVDRLEHRDRLGRLRRRMPTRDIAHVEVQKRLTGASLVIYSVAGVDLVLRGTRLDAAESVRATILANLAPVRRPADLPTPAPFDEAELLRKLVDLYRAGVITGTELDAKTEVVAQLAKVASGASRAAAASAPVTARPLPAPAPSPTASPASRPPSSAPTAPTASTGGAVAPAAPPPPGAVSAPGPSAGGVGPSEVPTTPRTPVG